MMIFKIILGIIGAYLLAKIFLTEDTGEAYDYLFSATILFSIAILTQPTY